MGEDDIRWIWPAILAGYVFVFLSIQKKREVREHKGRNHASKLSGMLLSSHFIFFGVSKIERSYYLQDFVAKPPMSPAFQE